MNELIAGYANYAFTEAILQEQQTVAFRPEVSCSFTVSCTLSMSSLTLGI
ncbi:hypothetical protein ACIBF6_09350 [Streptosporangium amethystogenes]